MTEFVHAPTVVDDRLNTGGHVARGNDGVPAEWLNPHADKIREEWAASRRAMTDRLRAERRQRPLGARVDRAMTRLYGLSNLSAHQVQAGGRSTEDSKGGGRPPGESTLSLDSELRVLVAAVEALERAIDVEQGLAPEGAANLMGTNDKDRELFTQFAGVRAELVAEDHPHLGHKRTIYRRRKAAGFDARGLDPDTGMAPSLERVNRAVVELSDTRPLRPVA